jgi:hypothetical protein
LLSAQRFARVTLCLVLTLSPVSVRPEHSRPSSADFPAPPGLPAIPWPQDNPYSTARAELGKILIPNPTFRVLYRFFVISRRRRIVRHISDKYSFPRKP